ncbi:UNVERIFIED_CONTAM: hypothetical protein GTU68_002320, partial [Idotea baltica]|nr:hypothetical protein [Idotea baltica]
MAGSDARLRQVVLLFCLLLVTQPGRAVVGPSNSADTGSTRTRDLSPPPCPSNCFCSLFEARCEQWSTYPEIEGTLPPRTRLISLKSFPGRYFRRTNLLVGLRDLGSLSMTHGSLVSFPEMPPVPTLVYLDFSDNQIENFSWEYLNNTLHLVHLNLSGNSLGRLGALDSHPPVLDLKALDLSRNPSLSPVPVHFFASTPRLKLLNLSGTNLTSFPEEWSQALQHLQFLDLSHNGIESLPPMTFEALEVLDVSHNPLLLLPQLQGFSHLKQLLLAHTLISNLMSSHTQNCNSLQVLDLSYSNLTKLNEDVLSQCKHLKEINFSHNPNLWRIEHGALSGLKNLTTLRINNCPSLFDLEENALNGLESLTELNLQESGIKILPHSLIQLKNISKLNLEGTTLYCDCYAHWFPELLSFPISQSWKGFDPIHCNDGIDRTREDIAEHLNELECEEVEAHTEANHWVLAAWGQSALLECNVTGNPTPIVVWETVDQHLHVYNTSIKDHIWVHHHISEVLSFEADMNGKFQVLKSGQLLIRNVTRKDIGRYKCFAINAVSNTSIVTFVGLKDTAFRALVLESTLFGFACAALFLLITLLVQFIKFVMERMGWECCCCESRLSPKAKQIRQLIESVETYKTAQLDKLRENYTSQVVNIKDSCYQQMERLRESYAQQSKNLKDLCDYSTLQISGARDQYLDQVNKVRDYSMGQMNKVRENYVFQRHRIRKFSGHQLLRLRETYKYQQKTLNKLLETLPDLYIQNCRTGSCQRTDSLVFDDEIDGLDVYYKVDFLDGQSFSSDYYTPNSTLTRQSKSGKMGHSRNASTISGGTEYQEAHSWVVRQESFGNEKQTSDGQRFHSR